MRRRKSLIEIWEDPPNIHDAKVHYGFREYPET